MGGIYPSDLVIVSIKNSSAASEAIGSQDEWLYKQLAKDPVTFYQNTDDIQSALHHLIMKDMDRESSNGFVGLYSRD